MKVVTKDILGQVEIYNGVEVSLIDSKGILVLSTPYKNEKAPGHRVIRTYILHNLVYYETELESIEPTKN